MHPEECLAAGDQLAEIENRGRISNVNTVMINSADLFSDFYAIRILALRQHHSETSISSANSFPKFL